MTLWPTLILLCYISKVLIKGRESAVWLECSINPEYSLWAEKAFFSEKTKKTMTSTTTGCPLKGSRASYSVHGASLFFRRTKVNLQLFLQPGSLSQIDILQTLRRKLLSLSSSKCFQLHFPPGRPRGQCSDPEVSFRNVTEDKLLSSK